MASQDIRETQELTLFIETNEGVVIRRVMPARPLPEGGPRGRSAEDMARSAAAVFGLPDFVFRARVRATGSGSRELGDAIVTVGEVAAVVQVKARTAPSELISRERAWLDRNINKAVRQANGTIRHVRNSSEELTNERGRRVQIDGKLMRWVAVTVVDHPNPPTGYVPSLTVQHTVVLLRRDWEFLFDQLRSTDAVVRYLLRVGDMDPVELGDEPSRYYQLAMADAAAEPTPLHPTLQAIGGTGQSRPVLPMLGPDHDEWQYHVVLRAILEDIATAPRVEEGREADVLYALAAIDTLPVGMRTDLGRTLLTWLREGALKRNEGIQWQFRRVLFPGKPHLVFATANQWSQEIQGAFSMYVQLRHQQLVEAYEWADDLLTVGVLLTPRASGSSSWDTTLFATRGRLELDATYRRDMEQLWPVPAAAV